MSTRFGFVSTYPPTLCGLATFTTALRGALTVPGAPADPVVRLVEADQGAPGAASARRGAFPEVVGELVAGDPRGPRRAAALLADCDTVVVQHEYGVYGGPDGDEVLALLAALTVPSLVVLHTVLSNPTPHQRRVLEDVAALADGIVCMTGTARDRLRAGYDVDMGAVSVIPHGAPALAQGRLGGSAVLVVPTARAPRPTVLTWGLIGPGKGIEWGIEALADLRDLTPRPRYVVAGQTHPKVLLHEGEAYRSRLARRVTELSLDDDVVLDGRYRDAAALATLVASADVVLLPYDSRDQVTSGVLIEAVAALKPVVATRFPHAVELLGGGAGLLVSQQDPAGMAAALRTVLTSSQALAGMNRAAAATAPELAWPAVAQRYRALAERLVRERVAA